MISSYLVKIKPKEEYISNLNFTNLFILKIKFSQLVNWVWRYKFFITLNKFLLQLNFKFFLKIKANKRNFSIVQGLYSQKGPLTKNCEKLCLHFNFTLCL